MDSDDEEAYAALMEEEAEAAKGDEELLMILGALSAMFVQNDEPRRGGSAPGRRKSKVMQNLEGYCIIYGDYFADAPMHRKAVFRRSFRMSRKVFLTLEVHSGYENACI